MRYYKQLKNDEITSYHAYMHAVDSVDMVEINEDEYNSAIEELRAKTEAESEAAEQSKDEYIAELESENAALLYQVLTGEEYSDV